MKKAEIIIALLALIALTLNLLLVPVGNILTVLSFSLLSMFYFCIGFALFNNLTLSDIADRDTFKKMGRPRLIGSIAAGIAIALTITGLLFRIQSWPGINLELGLICFLVIIVISLIKISKDLSGFYKRILTRIAVFGSIGLIFLLLPKTTMLELKYRNHPTYIEAYKKAMAEPDNYDLWEKVREEQDKIYGD